jgi:ankyrin repeat protein
MELEFIAFHRERNFDRIHEYVAGNYIHMVTILLDNGYDIRNVTEGKKSLVYYALNNGHLEMFDLLVSRGADITRSEDVLLHIACSKGYHSIIIRLLKCINPNRMGLYHNWTSPLHLAVQYNNINIAILLLNNKANPNIIDELKRTPLFHITSSEMGHILLNYGANIYAKDYRNDYCIFNVCSDALSALIHDPVLLNSTNNDGDTLLHKLIDEMYYCCDNTKPIQLLLDAACDLSLKNSNGYTPQEYALLRHYPEIASLIEHYETIPIKEPM